jgi:hypothetical protein
MGHHRDDGLTRVDRRLTFHDAAEWPRIPRPASADNCAGSLPVTGNSWRLRQRPDQNWDLGAQRSATPAKGLSHDISAAGVADRRQAARSISTERER